MTTPASFRKGWCPGALRPMPTGDGLLVRLRHSCGILPSTTALELARCATDYGNGLFDLSSRGNLQMRGVQPEALPHLQTRLDVLGLIDQDAQVEAVRNILVSPLAGLAAAIDVRPIAKALEAELAGNKALHALPGKFGFLIDDGTTPSLANIPADIRFDFIGKAEGFAIKIAGTSAQSVHLGHCEAPDIVSVAVRLASAFIGLGSTRDEPPRRMRDLVKGLGAETIAKAAGLSLSTERHSLTDHSTPIGLLSIGPELHGLCIAAPFGRLTASMLEGAAKAAARYALGELRLTPWRALLVPGIAACEIQRLRDHFASLNFIVDEHDPRLAIEACTGAPFCERATTQTHRDALALAGLARRLQKTGTALHVSGCAKGCARSAATAYTLTGNGGRYDLIVNGRPSDLPKARGLTLDAVKALFETICQDQQMEHA